MRCANRTNVPVMMNYDWQFIFGAKWWQTARCRCRAKTARDASGETSPAWSERRTRATVNASAKQSGRVAQKRRSSKRERSCERLGSDCTTYSASNDSLPEMWRGSARGRTVLPALPHDDAFRLPFLR
jgi:hypothetical protein